MPDFKAPPILTLAEAIFVINLPDRADRLRETLQELAKLGIGKNEPYLHIFPALSFSHKGQFPTAGARGCFESHLGVLRYAIAKEYKSILVFEDDIAFSPRIEISLPTAIAALSAVDWDIFYGSLLPGGLEVAGCPLVSVSPAAPLRGLHFFAIRDQAIMRAADYLSAMLERSAGKGHPDGEPMHVDGAYSVFRERNPDIKVWAASPDLGSQRLSRTDVHDLPFYDRLPILRGFSQFARRILKAAGMQSRIFR